MSFRSALLDIPRYQGLLIDTNLLVLFIVGSVRPERIRTFKRTQQYSEDDFQLLVEVLERAKQLHTVAHVLAEVSNLTDLNGSERLIARQVLRRHISRLSEAQVSSAQASDEGCYEALGLTDGAIAGAATKLVCTVLTDDFDLYVHLLSKGVEVINFTHLRKQAL